jgi:hypothetical protein
VIHLWHPEAERARLPADDALMNGTLGSMHTRAEIGLSNLRHGERGAERREEARC